MRPWLLLLAVLVLVTPRGGRADLGVKLEVDATVDATVAVTVVATNTGDEAVQAVVPEVRLQSTARRAEALTTLEVGQAHTWVLTLPPPGGPGTYALIARLAYAGGHRRSLGTDVVRLVSTPGLTGAAVTATLTVEPTDTHGTATFTLVNPTLLPIAGRVLPILPAQFTTDPETLPAQIPPQGRVVATFIVENGGALPGDSFPLYALFEYEQRGIHQSVLADAPLVVVPPRPGGAAPPLAIGGAALLLTAGLLALAWRRAARRG